MQRSSLPLAAPLLLALTSGGCFASTAESPTPPTSSDSLPSAMAVADPAPWTCRRLLASRWRNCEDDEARGPMSVLDWDSFRTVGDPDDRAWIGRPFQPEAAEPLVEAGVNCSSRDIVFFPGQRFCGVLIERLISEEACRHLCLIAEATTDHAPGAAVGWPSIPGFWMDE